MLAVSKSVSNILTQCHNVKEFIIPADNISKRSGEKKKKKAGQTMTIIIQVFLSLKQNNYSP